MKILYCLRSANIFNYHESVIESLSKNGHNVHIVFSTTSDFMDIDPNPIQRLKKLHSTTYEYLILKRSIIQKINLIIREVKSYQRYFDNSYQDNSQHSFYQERWAKYLPMYIRFIVTKISFFKFPLIRKLMHIFFNLIEFISGTPNAHKKIINDFSPDLIIGSPCNMRYSEEIDFIKYGRKKKIFSIISILSWDNLTTKGGFSISPDIFFVWNTTHEEELINYHNVDKKNIVICGSPFFDKWFIEQYDNFEEKDFIKSFNIEPNRKFIIYLGSSANLGKYDEEIIYEILKFLDNSDNSSVKDLILIIKPHLSNQDFINKFGKFNNVRVWKNDRDYDWIASQSLFKFALNNAICSLGLNTTAMIDSVINNCPVISIIHEKNIEEPTNSAIHFKTLLNLEIYHHINNINNLDLEIDFISNNNALFNEKRNRFISNFIRPINLKSSVGDITRKEIEKLF